MSQGDNHTLTTKGNTRLYHTCSIYMCAKLVTLVARKQKQPHYKKVADMRLWPRFT